MFKKTVMSTIAALVVTAFATTASAGQWDDVVMHETGKDGYGYVFKDDALQGGDLSSNTGMIRVLPKAARRTLIRPRLHFIPELLKSVENI